MSPTAAIPAATRTATTTSAFTGFVDKVEKKILSDYTTKYSRPLEVLTGLALIARTVVKLSKLLQ